MEFEPIDALEESDLEGLLALYRQVWWARDRQPAEVRTMLGRTDIVVGFRERETRRLAAFARVLTDGVYKALLFDVIVDERYRSTGLGRMLMDAVVSHPAVARVQHLELYCLPEHVPFYQQWGFTDDLGTLRYMRRQQGSEKHQGGRS